MDTKNLKFSNHLIERLRERNIKKEWLLDAIQHPDDKIILAEDGTHFYKIIAEYKNKWLKVVVNQKNSVVVTAYFDRNKKGKVL